MDKDTLAGIYRTYLACLNAQDWPNLRQFVADDAQHNGRPFGLSGYRAMLEQSDQAISGCLPFGLSGYRAMLEQDFRDIPDLRFEIALLVSDAPFIASRLAFDVTPKGISSASR